MTNTSRPAPIAHDHNSALIQNETFDPSAWLARYTALGGVYVANGKLNLCILVNKQTEDELSQIRQLVVSLTDDDKAIILAHLHAIEASPSMLWQDIVSVYRDLTAKTNAHPYGRTCPTDPAYQALAGEHSNLLTAQCTTLRRLLNTRTPNHAALLDKLDLIEAEYDIPDGIIGHLRADVARLGRGPQRCAGDPDRAIVAAWDRRAAAYARYNALPIAERVEAPDYLSPEERAEWAIIDEAEAIIQATIAATPQGVACQVWTALHHSVTGREDDAALHRADLAALEARGEDLDWNVRLLLTALRSLKSMEA